MVVFGAVLLGILVAALNLTVVSPALPRIAADLHGLEQYPWIMTSYIVTAAASLPLIGKLSDMYGRKPFFMGGIAVMLVGLVLAGTSQNIPQLAVYRAIQGVGAGALIATTMAIVGELFPPAEQARWRALNQGVFTLASILGPPVGGLITDYLSWRWVFYVNVPVGLVALAVAAVVMPTFRHDRDRHQVDYLGALALLLAVGPLLVALSLAGQRYPWGSAEIVGLLAVAGAMLAAFLLVEARASEPILPLYLFRNSIFVVSNATSFLMGLAMFGAITHLPLFVQAVSGQSATRSGLVLMPMSLTSFVAGVIGGQILSRRGKYRAMAWLSTGVAALGLYLLSRMGPETSEGVIAFNMVLLGLGLGVMMPLLAVVIQNALPQRMLGVAVSSLAFMRNLGGTIGVAVMGTIVTSQFITRLPTHLPGQAARALREADIALPTTPQALLNEGTRRALADSLRDVAGGTVLPQVDLAMRMSLAGALDAAFFLGAVAMGLAFLATLFLREIPLRTSNTPDGEEVLPPGVGNRQVAGGG